MLGRGGFGFKYVVYSGKTPGEKACPNGIHIKPGIQMELGAGYALPWICRAQPKQEGSRSQEIYIMCNL